MKINLRKAVFTAFVLYLLLPNLASASLIISEIMYDASGADTDREWVEIKNTGDDLDLTGYKFFDGANHVLNIPPKNGGRGNMTITSGGFIIFASSPDVFLAEYGGYAGSVIDTALVLSNTTSVLKIIDKDGAEVSSASYNKDLGANGDGNSLHYNGSKYVPSSANPGQDFSETSSNTSTNNTSSTNTTASTNTTSTTSTNTYKELLEIYADAGSDRVVMSGAEAIFNAKGYGTDKTPLTGARYVWNFGDGSLVEGQTVSHSFIYPGDYAVILYVSSGEYTANDKIVVKAIPSPISISQVNYFGDPYIKIKNDSTNDLDLSLWHIRVVDKYWSFPGGTFILKRNEVVLSSKRTGLYPKEGDEVALLYPNGEKAFVWKGLTTDISKKNTEETSKFISIQKAETPFVVSTKMNPGIDLSLADVNTETEKSETLSANVLSSGISSGGASKWILILLGISGFLIMILFIFSKKENLDGVAEVKTPPPAFSSDKAESDNDPYIPEADEFEIMEDLL